MQPETGTEEARHLSERISLSTEAENGNKLGRNRGGQNEFPMGVGSARPIKKPAGAGVDKCCPPSSGGRPLLSSLPPCPPGPLQPCGLKCHSPSLFNGRSVVERWAGKQTQPGFNPISKRWFTTSFLQPLPYLVTPQVPENCQTFVL